MNISKIEYQIHSFANSIVRTEEEKIVSVFIKEKQYIKKSFWRIIFFLKAKFILVAHEIKSEELGLKADVSYVKKKGFATVEEAEIYLKKLTEKPKLFVFDIESAVKKEITKI